MAKTELENRTRRFALDLIDLVMRLPQNRAGEVVGLQLLRSGCSLGANYREANRARSRKEFVYKVGIATKEASEAEYWLELVSTSDHLATDGSEGLLNESRELLAILITIGKNAEEKAEEKAKS